QRDNQTMIARITPIIFMQWLTNFTARCEEANEIFYANQQRKIATEKRNITDSLPAYWLLANYRVCDLKVYTFKALSNKITRIADEVAEAKEKDDAEFRQKQVEGYAKLHNINI